MEGNTRQKNFIEDFFLNILSGSSIFTNQKQKCDLLHKKCLKTFRKFKDKKGIKKLQKNWKRPNEVSTASYN